MADVRGPLNSTDHTTSILVGGVYNAVAPAPQDEQPCALQLDNEGNLLVNIAVGGGGVIATNNITEWNSVALGSPTSFGTAPSGNVIGTNAELFAGATSLTATGTSLNVNVTNSTGSTVTGSLTNNNAAPAANNLGVLSAVANAAHPTWTEGDQVLLSEDLSGNLRVITGAGSTTVVTGSVAVTGTFFQVTQPVSGTVAVSNFPATQPVSGTVAVSNFPASQVVTLASTTITGTVAVTQSTSPWVVSGTVTANAGTGNFTVVQPTGTNLHVVIDANSAVIGHVITDSGSVTNATLSAETTKVIGTVNQGTSPWVVSLASTTITGTVAVTQSTSPWIVAGGGTAGVPGTAVLTVQGIVGGTAIPISGTVTTTPSGLQNVNVTQWDTTALGAPSAYGTSPGAVEVIGVNAFITNTPAVTLASTTITGSVAVTGTFWQATQPISGAISFTAPQHVIVDSSSALTAAVTGTLTNNNAAPAANNLGVLPALANAANPSWTEGDQVLLSEDLSGHLRVVATGAAAAGAAVAGNPVLVAGQDINSGNVRLLELNAGAILSIFSAAGADGVSNASSGTLFNTAGTAGSLSTFSSIFNGTTWDRTRSAGIGNAVASTGIAASAGYGEYLSTAPAPTTGQYSALQTDYVGSLFIKHARRSETLSQATTIASSSASTTVLASGGANIFTDISNLIVTVTTAATTSIPFTVTLSDGTKSFIYDMETGSLTTNAPSPLALAFDPPLAASSAATVWTIALSVATVTVHIVVNSVLQKAS